MKTTDFEIRTSELSASDKKLVGYAVRWNSLSEIIWDEFREQFAPGAFKDSPHPVAMCVRCTSITIPSCWGVPNPARWCCPKTISGFASS